MSDRSGPASRTEARSGVRRRCAVDGAARCLPAVAVALALLFAAPTASAAGVYRWVDAAGQIHFDDHNTVRGIRLTREMLAERVVPPAGNDPGPVPLEWQALLQRECELQRARAAALDQPLRLYGRTPDGLEYPYTEQQRRLFQYETELAVREACAPDAAARAYRMALEGRRR